MAAINPSKVKAYATLIRAGLYVYSDSEKTKPTQTVLPQEYVAPVAEYIISQQ